MIENKAKVAKKCAPAKKDNTDKKLAVLVRVLEIENILTETTNSVTGEIEYILYFGEFNKLYILASDFHIMLHDNNNINKLYDKLITGGIEELIIELDNIQAGSKQVKASACHDMIEVYSGNITLFQAKVEISETNYSKAIIDTILVS